MCARLSRFMVIVYGFQGRFVNHEDKIYGLIDDSREKSCCSRKFHVTGYVRVQAGNSYIGKEYARKKILREKRRAFDAILLWEQKVREGSIAAS